MVWYSNVTPGGGGISDWIPLILEQCPSTLNTPSILHSSPLVYSYSQLLALDGLVCLLFNRKQVQPYRIAVCKGKIYLCNPNYSVL